MAEDKQGRVPEKRQSLTLRQQLADHNLQEPIELTTSVATNYNRTNSKNQHILLYKEEEIHRRGR